MSTVESYLGKWGKRVNFGNITAEILTKNMREKISDVMVVGGKKFKFQ